MRFRQWERPRPPFWRGQARVESDPRPLRTMAGDGLRSRCGDGRCLMPACRIAIFNLLKKPSHADFKKVVKIAGAYCDSKEEQAPRLNRRPTRDCASNRADQ